MYKNLKTCVLLLYLEELLFEVEKEHRITFIRRNKKTPSASVFLKTIYLSMYSFYLQSVGPVCFPQKLPFFLLLRLI